MTPAALIALLLAAAPAPAPVADAYLMSLWGTPVGTVRISLAERPGGREMTYESRTFAKRGSATVEHRAWSRLQLSSEKIVEQLSAETFEGTARLGMVSGASRDGVLRLTVAKGRASATAETRRALPSSLCFAAFGPHRSCLPVVDETSGEVGTACGERQGDEARGVLLGQPFVARLSGGRLERLELPEQHAVFERTDHPPDSFDPPDLLGRGLAAGGLEGLEEADSLRISLHAGAPLALPASAHQVATATADGAMVRWTRVPALDERLWKASRQLAEQVFDSIPDKRPSSGERDPSRALREGRGACVAHAAAFLAQAASRQIVARRALGLVAAAGLFWPHEWVQVQIRGAWYDVDPTEGEAPARSARILVAAGAQADEKAAQRLVELVRSARAAVEGGR